LPTKHRFECEPHPKFSAALGVQDQARYSG
jgi:hypothetical protein